MYRLTFEFLSAAAAQWFLDRVDASGRRSHRVVTLRCRGPLEARDAREMAASMGGVEGEPEPTFRTVDDEGSYSVDDVAWSLANFAANNAEDEELPVWIEQLARLQVGEEAQLEFLRVRRMT